MGGPGRIESSSSSARDLSEIPRPCPNMSVAPRHAMIENHFGNMAHGSDIQRVELALSFVCLAQQCAQFGVLHQMPNAKCTDAFICISATASDADQLVDEPLVLCDHCRFRS